MPIDLYMPALSPTMETGTLAKWLKNEGDEIASGDVIAEIETDKATMEFEAVDEGVLAKILVAEGTDDVAVGTLIAVMAEEDEDVSAAAASAGSSAAPKAEPTPAPETAETPEPLAAPAPQGPAPVAAAPAVTTSAGERIKASPLAKRMAAQKGLDLKAVAGSGPYGRIVKRDVEAAEAAPVVAAPATPAASAPAPAAASAPAAAPTYGAHEGVPHRVEKLNNMRKTIAKRLSESKSTVPHFYLTIDCELDALLAQRKTLNARLDGTGTKLSVNDFIIRACALALKKVPAANVQFAGGEMIWYERADISVAVAIDGGLITPVVKGADQKGLADISSDMKSLAAKARDGKLAPEDYAGGTFSISNLGMFGIKDFKAVINPPQACILAVGAGEQRAVVKDGAVSTATVMSVTLSCDHRAVDGAVGAEFLQAFKGYIQDPLTMLL